MDWFAKVFIRASLLWFIAVAGFTLSPHIGADAIPVTATGGALWALGAYGFVYNVWRTFDAAERRRRLNAQTSASRQLPTPD